MHLPLLLLISVSLFVNIHALRRYKTKGKEQMHYFGDLYSKWTYCFYPSYLFLSKILKENTFKIIDWVFFFSSWGREGERIDI